MAQRVYPEVARRVLNSVILDSAKPQ